MKFYKCDHCGKIIVMMEELAIPTVCCGEPMHELEPQTADMSTEKHVPVIKQDGNKVNVFVGSTPHPMMEKHFIQWIVLETDQGFYKKGLKPETQPEANFVLTEGEKVVAAYEYCNLHGLWVNKL